MSYSDIVRGIREKFVGNMEEHELLRRLQESSSDVEIDIQTRIEQEYRERLESLEWRETRCRAMEGSEAIDQAVYDWLRTDDEWHLSYVVGAMKGRGLSVEHLEKVVSHMKVQGEKS